MDRELEFVIPHSPMFDNQPLPKLYCNCGFRYDNGMKRMIASPSVSGGLEHSLFDCIPLPLLITTGYIVYETQEAPPFCPAAADHNRMNRRILGTQNPNAVPLLRDAVSNDLCRAGRHPAPRARPKEGKRMTWLDVGNGWRNLFLLSSLLQAFSLGVLFAVHRFWMKQNRVAAFLAGAALTPFAQYLWMLLLAFLWPHAPKLLIIGVPPLLAGVYLLVLLIKTRGRWITLLKGGIATLRRIHLDRTAIISVCFALAMGILLLPVCVRTATSAISAQGDSGEYMGLALRYAETRETAGLFEKDDTQTDYRGHSHFPSLELYMAYGLLHTSDTYGYPYDKPAFTATGILIFYLLAAFIALCLRVTRGKLRWLMVALLLFNLIPNFVYSIGGATRDTWRILAVLLVVLALFDLRPAKGRRYTLSLLFAFAVGFTAMSAHVLCFVIVPFIVIAWVFAVFIETIVRRDPIRHTLPQSIGMALAAAGGLLVAFAGNLWCYFKWGAFSPWRVMTTYTDAPWFDTYMRLDYRLEETTTSLNFWNARYDIVMAHASPVGIWGIRIALIALVFGIGWILWKRRQAQPALAQPKPDLPVLTIALLTLCTLAPMTGLLDSPLYSFSGTFIKLTRYTLQWYFLACAMIAAVGAFVEDTWPSVLTWVQKKLPRRALPAWLGKLPAYLCVLLCVAWFAEGVKVTGYSASFYRCGRPWLTDSQYAQDTYITSHYGTLLRLAPLLEKDQNLIITRANYQYPLHSRALLLTANPVAPILNLPLEAIPDALAAQNIVAVVTEPGFWDDRLFAETTLNDYLCTLPPDQIVQEDNMRIYLTDAALAAKLHEAFPTP